MTPAVFIWYGRLVKVVAWAKFKIRHR
jgi:hypothetical protein